MQGIARRNSPAARSKVELGFANATRDFAEESLIGCSRSLGIRKTAEIDPRGPLHRDRLSQPATHCTSNDKQGELC